MRGRWPIYIISLRDAGARRERCALAMAEFDLPFAFFDAVDGSLLGEQDIAGVYDAQKNAAGFKRPMSLPEIGCYLSHHALWRRVADGDCAGAIILEDDFEPRADLPALVDWLSGLGLANCLVKLDAGDMTGAALVAQRDGMQLHALYAAPPLTPGYAIDRAAAAQLAQKSLPFGRPVDIDLKHWWRFGIAMLAVLPAPLTARESKSAIEESRIDTRPSGRWSALRRFGRNLKYQLSYRRGLIAARRTYHCNLRRMQSQFAVKR